MLPKPDFGVESYKGSGKLDGRAAIITGGDSGIGRAVALAYAREGADIVIGYLSEDDDANDTRSLVESAGRTAVLVRGDIQTQSVCEQLLQTCIERFVKLDILVNNAAYQKPYKDFDDITEEELIITFRTNVFAPFFLSRGALKIMEPGGCIINTTSIQSFDPSPPIIIYASTKAAITNLTKTLSKSAIQKGVRVNAVAPGPIWTPFIPAAIEEKKMKNFGSDNPMKRPGQPAELAGTFVLLASEEGSFINGQVIGVTGGEFTE